MADYIKFLRSHIGSAPIILNFAGGVIRDGDGGVLLQLRGDREEDVWGFPGGAVEFGESVQEAAVREILEETGLTVAVTGLLGIYSKYFDTYPNGDTAQSITTFFYCEIVDGAPRVDGHETLGLQYFALTDLPSLVNQQHYDAAADIGTDKARWR